MVNDSGELDPETGDLKWVSEEDTGEEAKSKVYIGKVRLNVWFLL